MREESHGFFHRVFHKNTVFHRQTFLFFSLSVSFLTLFLFCIFLCINFYLYINFCIPSLLHLIPPYNPPLLILEKMWYNWHTQNFYFIKFLKA